MWRTIPLYKTNGRKKTLTPSVLREFASSYPQVRAVLRFNFFVLSPSRSDATIIWKANGNAN